MMSKSKKTFKSYLASLLMFVVASIITILILIVSIEYILKIFLNKEEAYIPDVVGMHIDKIIKITFLSYLDILRNLLRIKYIY